MRTSTDENVTTFKALPFKQAKRTSRHHRHVVQHPLHMPIQKHIYGQRACACVAQAEPGARKRFPETYFYIANSALPIYCPQTPDSSRLVCSGVNLGSHAKGLPEGSTLLKELLVCPSPCPLPSVPPGPNQ